MRLRHLFVLAVFLAAGVAYRVVTAHRRVVIAYNAVDVEHGPVRIVVTSNRLTGTLTRRVYAREVSDDPND